MTRLTKWNTDHTAVDINVSLVNEALCKLARYEDEEEAGTLVRVPFNTENSSGFIIEYSPLADFSAVREFHVSMIGIVGPDTYVYDEAGNYYPVGTVFTDRASAEDALRKFKERQKAMEEKEKEKEE